MTRRSLVVLAATVVALSAALLFLFFARGAREEAAVSGGSEQTPLIDPGSRESATVQVASVPTRPIAGGKEIRMGDPLQEPKTPEEVQWLRRNGYPSEEELRDAMNGRASITDLNLADGISGWELVRAEQVAILDPQNRKQAISFLQEAANQGSIYALQSLGLVYGDPRSGNIVQSEAYYKAAAMRGDWSAHMRITQVQPSAEQELISSLMAHQILESIDRSRKAKGLQALGIDPRPDVNDFLMKLYEELKKQK